MKRLVAGFLLGAALVAPSGLRAQTLTNGSTYEFCGGGAYIFCGMVNLTITNPSVGLYHVALVVVNRSGELGSRAGARSRQDVVQADGDEFGAGAGAELTGAVHDHQRDVVQADAGI
ncbi:MAG: hypothetical protein ACHQRK_08425, partial [Gemmatimonadales bacterium]